jgi:hypothetical protein
MFTFRRFLATFCMRRINHRHILGGYVTIFVIFSAVTDIGRYVGVAFYMVLCFFERYVKGIYALFGVDVNCSLCYPTIFVVELTGLETRWWDGCAIERWSNLLLSGKSQRLNLTDARLWLHLRRIIPIFPWMYR